MDNTNENSKKLRKSLPRLKKLVNTLNESSELGGMGTLSADLHCQKETLATCSMNCAVPSVGCAGDKNTTHC